MINPENNKRSEARKKMWIRLRAEGRVKGKVICKNCGIRTKTYPSSNKTGLCKKCSRMAKNKKMSGPNHCKWINDRTQVSHIEKRNNSAHKYWRKQVWLRDNFTCKIANPDCKGRLEAHHILAWREHPELRYDINNGITLCHAHHPKKRIDEAKLSPYFQKLVAEMN